jgi:hypothetical protein
MLRSKRTIDLSPAFRLKTGRLLRRLVKYLPEKYSPEGQKSQGLIRTIRTTGNVALTIYAYWNSCTVAIRK